MSEAKLMKIKKEIEKNDKQIQKDGGKLEALFDKYKNILNLPSDTSNDDVLEEIEAKVLALEEAQGKDKERLEVLMETIEKETEEWED